MLAQRFYSKEYQRTADELRQLLRVRLEVLHAVAMLDCPEKASDASLRAGYSARVKILGRDRSGCLCARIVALAPHLTQPYTRNVRLVKKNRLRLV